jgi:hypothetical protein
MGSAFDDQKDPADGLKQSKYQGGVKANACAPDQAEWLFPGVNGNDDGGRPGDKKRQEAQVEGEAVVEGAALFEVCKLPFLLSGLEANRTDMLIVQFDIAKRAKKASTGSAWDASPFLRVIKATGFALDEDGFTGFSRVIFPEDRGIEFRLNLGRASRAFLKLAGIDRGLRQGHLTLRASSSGGH